jgi:hypothetical protein
MAKLDRKISLQPMNFSLHVCGHWVREICKGNWTPLIAHHPQILAKYRRVQLNFHAYTHSLGEQFFEEAKRVSLERQWQLIFQVDGVNDHLMSNAQAAGINAVPLYDKSGGAGVVPEQWPQQMAGMYSGYAGGLGPDNVLEQLTLIENVAMQHGTIWIDMERRVRTEDDSELDEQAVEKVLSAVASSRFIARAVAADPA